MIVWDESISTGIARLDAQHKMLFQKFNELAEAMAGTAARDTAGEVLDFLQFYAQWHFEQEEKAMEACQCPAAAENKQAHAEFTRSFGQFYAQWQEGTMTPALVQQTYVELENWLVNHISRIDVQLRTACDH